jgi:hypothetical protein
MNKMNNNLITKNELRNAIQYNCTNCCGFDLDKVGKCEAADCFLFPYRMGGNINEQDVKYLTVHENGSNLEQGIWHLVLAYQETTCNQIT